MASVRKKYNWSHKTLTTTPCQHCGNVFKPQGLRSHELHCVRRKGKERQHVQSSMEYEQVLEQSRAIQQQMAMSSYTNLKAEAGPSGSIPFTPNPISLLTPHQNMKISSDKTCWIHVETPEKKLIIVNPPPRWPAVAAINLHLQSHYQTSRRNFTHAAVMLLFSNTKKISAYGMLLIAAHGVHSPFAEEGDYLFAEIALQAGLNSLQVNGLLGLISRISQGKAKVTLRNEIDLRRSWDRAAAQVTPLYF
ncbi:hypothetical protein OG21DRAFT_1527044 [Imleria badia]|nr:hypothetical protein OG21DRAFT_1527044 [Imleria badia]